METPTSPTPAVADHLLVTGDTLSIITLGGLAELLGCTRATVRHFADRLGFRFTCRRVGARRKLCSCLTAAQAAAISAAHYADLAAHPLPSALDPAPAPGKSDVGDFYLLQLEPEFDPGRFKLGFSSELESRLSDLLTAAPFARCLATWPAQRSWERIAIICTAQNATQIRQEVYRCDNIEDAIAMATRFFELMPKLERQPISRHDPQLLRPRPPLETAAPQQDATHLHRLSIARENAAPSGQSFPVPITAGLIQGVGAPSPRRSNTQDSAETSRTFNPASPPAVASAITLTFSPSLIAFASAPASDAPPRAVFTHRPADENQSPGVNAITDAPPKNPGDQVQCLPVFQTPPNSPIYGDPNAPPPTPGHDFGLWTLGPLSSTRLRTRSPILIHRRLPPCSFSTTFCAARRNCGHVRVTARNVAAWS